MATISQPPFTPRTLVRILLRHKGKVMLWSVAVMTLACAAVIVMPRTYGSQAKLLLRLGRENLTLDPSATTGRTVQIQETRENQINSTRDLLLSRSLLEHVVKVIGPETILWGSPDKSANASSTGLRARLPNLRGVLSAINLSPPISLEERAVTRLQNSLHVAVARTSSVIDVEFSARSPQLAQQILQEFLDRHEQEYVQANRTEGTLNFFSAQSAELKKRLDDATERLRTAKNEAALVSIAAEQESLQKQLIEVESASFDADASLVAADASILRLQKTLAALPERFNMEQTSGFPNVAADNMRQELFKVQMSVRDLEAKLGAEHPLVLTARKHVKQSEEFLSSQPAGRVQTTSGINPAFQSIELDLRREEVVAAGLEAKGRTLKEQYALLQKRTRELNDHEVRIAQLGRQVDIAADAYRTYMEHMEQARIGQALADSQICNINVVQPPTFVEKPESPKPFLILVAGLMAAVFGSLTLAVGSEQLYKPVSQAERLTERPRVAGQITTKHGKDREFVERPGWDAVPQV